MIVILSILFLKYNVLTGVSRYRQSILMLKKNYNESGMETFYSIFISNKRIPLHSAAQVDHYIFLEVFYENLQNHI